MALPLRGYSQDRAATDLDVVVKSLTADVPLAIARVLRAYSVDTSIRSATQSLLSVSCPDRHPVAIAGASLHGGDRAPVSPGRAFAGVDQSLYSYAAFWYNTVAVSW